jgi:hypothetical protein
MSQSKSGVMTGPGPWLEATVVWVLSASLIGLVAALTGYFLAPQVCVAATFVTALYVWIAGVDLRLSSEGRDWRPLLILILITLFFRLPTFHFVFGGQDEGVYVNMAHYIDRTGGIALKDDALDALKGSDFVDRYLAENRNSKVVSTRTDAQTYLSGIYVRNGQPDTLEFQFYHLFPVWMAIVGGIFGAPFVVYALTLFALLSVIFMYRLAGLMTGSRTAAFSAGLLLALNPLHAFFSKFPVTEVPALTFSLIGFTYLAMYWYASPIQRRRRWLLLSAGAFGALFVTRISGFMYLPFFIAMAMAVAIGDKDRRRCRDLQCWTAGVAFLFAMSVFYGLHWSRQYSLDIYDSSFDRIFQGHWRRGIACVVLAILTGWAGVLLLARRDDRLQRVMTELLRVARIAITPIAVLAVVVCIYRIHMLGWSEHFRGDVWLDTTWSFVGTRWLAFRVSSLATVMWYVGPFALVVFFIALLRRREDAGAEFLRLFSAGFLVYILLLQWIIPYGPYYARYLLSELVPCLLLFVVVAWSMLPVGWLRRAVAAVLIFTVFYSGVASFAQLGKNESEGLYEQLAKLLAPVDTGDVVLVDSLDPQLPDDSELKTAARFTFGAQAITVSRDSLAESAYLSALYGRYDDVFLISPLAKAPENFEPVDSSRIQMKAFEWGHSLPLRMVVREDMRLYLYHLTRPRFPLEREESFRAPGSWNGWLVTGWDAPEPGGVWSRGNHADIVIDPSDLPSVPAGIHLAFTAVGLVTPEHSRQRAIVKLNGVEVGQFIASYPDGLITVGLDISAAALSSGKKIRIGLDLPDAASPKSLGINEDLRMLAIQLRTLTANSIQAPDPAPAATTQELPAAPSTH